MIPLTKRADLADDFVDKAKTLIWDPARGPVESLFRLAENSLVVFGGGPLAFLLISLKLAGFPPSRIGRMIDQGNGLTSLTDFMAMDHQKAADEIAGQIESHVQTSGGFGYRSMVSDSWGAKKSRLEPELKKSAILGVGRAGIAAVFIAAFGWLAKALMSPTSIISKLLRGAVVVGVESQEDDPAKPTKSKEPAATKQTPKQQLENLVDRILGA